MRLIVLMLMMRVLTFMTMMTILLMILTMILRMIPMMIRMMILMMVGAGTCILSKFPAAVPGSLGPAACLAVVPAVAAPAVVLVESTRQNIFVWGDG